ncbi:MAG TPA: preprotein translocase subunit SecA [Pirellulales bacterium]|nr:preprotein translocase subunit SecA [Pirellulales bacterium]
MVRASLFLNRRFDRAQGLLRRVGELEAALADLSDKALERSSRALRYRSQAGESLVALVPEAFALVREASRRTIGLRHFDVQILGGIALCRRSVAEMQTGEGKSLTATLPLYLHALAGRGAHLATTNNYLARRDAEWMRPVYELLGMSVGLVESSSTTDERRTAYACDITYGTAKEFGFDFLRDLLRLRQQRSSRGSSLHELRGGPQPLASEPPVGRDPHFILVDEADSLLIDDAGTPLIISASGEDDGQRTLRYQYCAQASQRFRDVEHYEADVQRQNIALTAAGRQLARALPLPEGLATVGLPTLYADLERALRAARFFRIDQQYVVRDGEICIVDEFTGRIAEGRKWRSGLHQAVEAKEHLAITSDGGQAAHVTVQDFFMRYTHLAGMSGTVASSARELKRIYRLRTSVIPTNRPVVRHELPAQIFGTAQEKWVAIVDEVRQLHAQGRPVLVGTRSIDKSEDLSKLLAVAGIEHQVLNAHQVAREAEIVADAGQRGRVTVSTNMAGRGTDIVLGPGVAELGGLHVIATELHDARRVDLQLIGRCGRQGDPGTFRQYAALDDDLLERAWGDETAIRTAQRAQRSQDAGLRCLRRAQGELERQHFERRRELLWHEENVRRSRRQMGMDMHLDLSF